MFHFSASAFRAIIIISQFWRSEPPSLISFNTWMPSCLSIWEVHFGYMCMIQLWIRTTIVTCLMTDDFLSLDLWPVVHPMPILGHIFRFGWDLQIMRESRAYPYLARCMQRWHIRYPHDDSLVESIESHLARHGWSELIWFFDLLHSRCHTGAYSPSWSGFIDPHWFTWSSTVMGYAPGRCSTSFCPDTPRSLSWVIQPDSYPFI